MKKSILILITIICAVVSYAQKPALSNSTIVKAQEGTSVAQYNLLEFKNFINSGATSGTVTTVSVTVPAGLTVNVSNPTTTPAIAITNNMSAGVMKSAGVGGALTSGSVNLATEVTGLLPNANLANSSISHSVGTSGTDVNISAASTSLGGSFTINVPAASASASGKVTTTAQTYAGNKTFQNGITTTGAAAVAAEKVDGAMQEAQLTTSTATTTLDLTNNNVRADAASASRTITLPACSASTLGVRYDITRVDASTSNTVTLNTSGSDTFIGGGTSRTLWGQGVNVICTCGANTTWDLKW